MEKLFQGQALIMMVFFSIKFPSDTLETNTFTLIFRCMCSDEIYWDTRIELTEDTIMHTTEMPRTGVPIHFRSEVSSGGN